MRPVTGTAETRARWAILAANDVMEHGRVGNLDPDEAVAVIAEWLREYGKECAASQQQADAMAAFAPVPNGVQQLDGYELAEAVRLAVLATPLRPEFKEARKP